tara:strand:- start:2182 stop:2541 length:360 start_codon:yes stop_codon:yes gene_type:complete
MTELLKKNTDLHTEIKVVVESIIARNKDKNKNGFFMKKEEFETLKNIVNEYDRLNGLLVAFVNDYQLLMQNFLCIQTKTDSLKTILQICYEDYKSKQRIDAVEFLEFEAKKLNIEQTLI